MAMHLNSLTCLCQSNELRCDLGVQLAVAILHAWSAPHASAGGFMSHASNVFSHTEQVQASIKYLTDLCILLYYVILSLKMLRIKLCFHNKCEYDKGEVVKWQNLISLQWRRSCSSIIARSPRAAQPASWVPHASGLCRKKAFIPSSSACQRWMWTKSCWKCEDLSVRPQFGGGVSFNPVQLV